MKVKVMNGAVRGFARGFARGATLGAALLVSLAPGLPAQQAGDQVSLHRIETEAGLFEGLRVKPGAGRPGQLLDDAQPLLHAAGIGHHCRR